LSTLILSIRYLADVGLTNENLSITAAVGNVNFVTLSIVFYNLNRHILDQQCVATVRSTSWWNDGDYHRRWTQRFTRGLRRPCLVKQHGSIRHSVDCHCSTKQKIKAVR